MTFVQDQRALHGHFSMGNGFVLNSLFENCISGRDQRMWWNKFCDTVPVNPHSLKSLIFSHEPWARKLPFVWDSLLQFSELINSESIVMWLLVRDPIDHAISVYGQMVKRHGFTGSLEEWLLIYDFPEVLMRFLDTVENSRVNVDLRINHYKAHRHDLLKCLLDWLELPHDSDWNLPRSRNVNRSLTSSELSLVRLLNSRSSELAARTADKLIQLPTNISEQVIFPSQQALDQFVKKWDKIVVQLNQRLPVNARLNLDTSHYILGSDRAYSEATTKFVSLTCEQLNCIFDSFQET